MPVHPCIFTFRKTGTMTLSIQSDSYFMQQALNEAKDAAEKGEIPVGAVVTVNGRIIARGHNLTETLTDVTAHAEMQLITAAANELGSKYLPECTLYVTLEPCPMCAGALYWSQIGRIVIGTKDEKRGFTTIVHQMLHPKTEVSWGVLEAECREILVLFFKKLRKSKGL
jgi:tRNA(adenine34) deaminase